MIGDRHKFHFGATILQKQSLQVIVGEEVYVLGIIVGLRRNGHDDIIPCQSDGIPDHLKRFGYVFHHLKHGHHIKTLVRRIPGADIRQYGMQILHTTLMNTLVQGHAIGEGCPDSSPPAPETHRAGKKEHTPATSHI